METIKNMTAPMPRSGAMANGISISAIQKIMMAGLSRIFTFARIPLTTFFVIPCAGWMSPPFAFLYVVIVRHLIASSGTTGTSTLE
jgi:hypothetical protein